MANLLSDTINFISPFCRYQSPAVGTNNMPIIGIASIVRNIILAAPFTWRWNRNNVNITGPVIVNQQDYPQAISDLGFLEKAIANDGQTSYEFKDVKNNEALASSNTVGRPMTVAIQTDDGAGNYVFRLGPVPDKNYTINMVYQKLPIQFQNLTDGWAPIPDSFSDVYNNLCLGYYMDSCQDPRAPQYIARGIAGLLARASGLSQMDKAIFASSYMNYESAQMLNQLRAQQATQAQGSR
jgi:hypothetical protein